MQGARRWGKGTCCICLGMAACGGEAEAPSSSVVAPPGTPASNLDAADTEALCDVYISSLPSKEDTCRYVATAQVSRTSAGSAQERREECEELEAECLESFGEFVETVRRECERAWFGPSCTATASTVEQCFRALPRTYESFYAQVPSCSSDLDVSNEVDSVDLSQACSEAMAQCRSLFGGSGQLRPEPVTPAAASCERTCEEYEVACSTETCPAASCATLVSVFGEACEPMAQSFFDCTHGLSFDCDDDNLLLAAQGCAQERVDLVTCYDLDGASCAPEPAFDETCARRNPDLPRGRRCVSGAAPEECELFASGYYCCREE